MAQTKTLPFKVGDIVQRKKNKGTFRGKSPGEHFKVMSINNGYIVDDDSGLHAIGSLELVKHKDEIINNYKLY